MRAAAFMLTFLMGAAPVWAQNGFHITYDKGSASSGPISSQSLDGAIEARAIELLRTYPQGADRIAHSDGAYPIDSKEYGLFGKRGVIVLAAITHNPYEIPLKRVYMRLNGQDTELAPVLRVDRPVTSESVRKAFGQFREDSVYLVPASAMASDDVLLLCDFAANRREFVFSNSAYTPPDFIKSDPDKSVGPIPSDEAVKVFLKREYPGLFEKALQ